ncbi:MAG TPA: sialidase family protein [Tangfeifania sp.]|nr:sialidase family protein [Tangfeifania sp.]
MTKLSWILFLPLLIFSSISNSENIHFENVNHNQKKQPLFSGQINKGIIKLHFKVSETAETRELLSAKIHLTRNSEPEFLQLVEVEHTEIIDGKTSISIFGNTSYFEATRIIIGGSEMIEPGSHTLSFNFEVKKEARLEQSFRIEKVELIFKGSEILTFNADDTFAYRPAKIVREAGQDGADTYRIPGLVTTNKGTLIAVYDNRYNNSKDLQEDIDVGMSRSTDGGQTWEPMQIIMDMGEWGGRPERINGIGDPAVLYDDKNHILWVAGLWMSGATPEDMLWWASEPGMDPAKTGQFVLVKSTDDGRTWSEPINITEQIKDPEWQLLLQGPGKGITMKDGTMVFPAQFKKDIGEKAIDGGQYTCHSTIVYSQDDGKTWNIGTGAKPNTTEAQVVQLEDGSLMLNMRDDRNRSVKDDSNGRAVAVTDDLGEAWTTHPTSNSALQEPNCMASLIAADVDMNGQKQQALFFSNPNNKEARVNMTIKASLDQGNSWLKENQVLLNENQGFGYSCMTMVDKNTVGILYEGVKELYFQKVPVDDIFSER